MSSMQDVIRTQIELGETLRAQRKAAHMRATAIAQRAGVSRDVLHRMEKGGDVTVSSLMAVLSAMGYVLRIEKQGLPTLEEMRQRFALDEDD